MIEQIARRDERVMEKKLKSPFIYTGDFYFDAYENPMQLWMNFSIGIETIIIKIAYDYHNLEPVYFKVVDKGRESEWEDISELNTELINKYKDNK